MQNSLIIYSDDGMPVFLYEKLHKSDFESSQPYDYLLQIEDPIIQFDEENKMRGHADRLGYGKRNFDTRYKLYNKQSQEIGEVAINTELKTSFIEPDGRQVKLNTSWIADNEGIYKYRGENKSIACSHPIYVKTRLKNIDTGFESVEIRFKSGNKWESIITPKANLSTMATITKLSNYGISVTSANGNELIEYLQELQDLNKDSIKVVESTSRLGWNNNFQEFIPYSSETRYDGDASYTKVFNSVKPTGARESNHDAIKEIWDMGVEPKIILTGSAASPLIEIVRSQVTYIHCWSSLSGSGKPVFLNAAASIWANPDEYVKSFNSTVVAQEVLASTLNSLPMCLDELQTQSDGRGGNYHSVYKLTDGKTKSRANPDGTLRPEYSWANTILTNGESPLIKESAGEGEFARTIEVELKNIFMSASDGNRLSNLFVDNNGHVGKELIDLIQKLGVGEIRERFSKKVDEINSYGEVHPKHVNAGSIILLASELLGEVLQIENYLTIEDIEPYLLKSNSRSIGLRAYNRMIDYVASRSSRFLKEQSSNEYESYEMDGILYESDDGIRRVGIIRSNFNEIMAEFGLPANAVLSEWRSKGWIETRYIESSGKTLNTIRKRINGNQVYIVSLSLEIAPQVNQVNQVNLEKHRSLAEELGWE